MEPCKTLNVPLKQAPEENVKAPRETGDEEDERREKQQFREISRARDSFWIDDFRGNEVVEFQTTGTTWEVGKIFSERQMRDCRIPEASALCVATQVEGPNPGSKAMLRIRQQIPDNALDPSDISPHIDYTWKEPLELGDYAEMELNYLHHLTKSRCSCTPKLIDYQIEVQDETDPVPGGFRLYILMEKIPGRNLVNFGELEMAERDQVRIAFAKARYEFYTCGLAHEDRHRRNLMWDRKNKKVYIIDLEAATHFGVTRPSLSREFYCWGLAGVSPDAREGGVDPMVPDRDAFDDYWPSEQELVKMAAAAVAIATVQIVSPRSTKNPNRANHPFPPKPLADLASLTNPVDEKLSSAFATVEIPVDILSGGGGEGKRSSGNFSERERSGEFEEYNHHSSSQSSSSGGSTGFDEENNDYVDEYDDDGMLVRTGTTSSRSSISSLPGSVVVHPRDSMAKGQQFFDGVYENEGYDGGEGFMNFIPRVRDKRSPFRHPSSVRAMQMNDGDDESVITPSRYGRHSQLRTPRMSETSRVSVTSPQSSSSNRYPRSPNNQSPTKQNIKKEYPLVLLHCNLLPPSLSLPAGIRVPHPRVLKDVLPQQFWRRWKLLEDKIVGSGVVQDRGVLISHPQEAYDMLEERLLESLELVAPRLDNGHFLGTHDEEDDDDEELEDDVRGSEAGVGHSEGHHECPDCGTKVVKDLEGDGRKWEIKVYAANGLMKAGAWAAAWREMEKVDVEVRVWLPEDVRRDLEARVLEDNALEMEEELRESEEERRRREVYGNSVIGSQIRIDTSFDGNDYNPAGSTTRLDASFGEEEIPRYRHEEFNAPPSPPQEKPEHTGYGQKNAAPEIDLQTLLFNYFRVLARDSRNVIIGFLGILVLFLAVNLNRGQRPVYPTETVLPEVVDTVALPSVSSECAPSIQSIPPAEITQPIVQEPIVQEPTVQESTVEEATVEEATVQEAIAQEPIVQEPIVQEPIVQEPIVEESPVDEASSPADDANEDSVPEASTEADSVSEEAAHSSQAPVPLVEAHEPLQDDMTSNTPETEIDEAPLPVDNSDPVPAPLLTEEEDKIVSPGLDETHSESQDVDESPEIPEDQLAGDIQEIAHGSQDD